MCFPLRSGFGLLAEASERLLDLRLESPGSLGALEFGELGFQFGDALLDSFQGPTTVAMGVATAGAFPGSVDLGGERSVVNRLLKRQPTCCCEQTG
ncbi:MAG: hypothetical protein AAF467_21845, partial [Actinomycetota bacterium]